MPLLCSACDPAIGRWHGQFPRRPAAGGWVTDGRGRLIWNKSEIEDWLGTPIEILGKLASSPPGDDENPLQPPPIAAAPPACAA
jgi:hypothetical protein